MKFSKVLHVGSVIVGLIGVVTFLGTVFGSSDGMAFGVTKMDALFCSAILILIAIFLAVSTIHHIMLERKGEMI